MDLIEIMKAISSFTSLSLIVFGCLYLKKQLKQMF